VRPRVDVAVAARHVAELADVDLDDLERRGAEALAPARGGEVGREVARAGGAAEGDGVEDAQLGRGRRQRRAAGAEARRGARPLGDGEDGERGHGGAERTCAGAGAGRRAHIVWAFAWSIIWRPWTSEAPPRMAQATWTASVICSRSAPFASDSCV